MIAEYHLRDYVHWTDFVGQEEVSAYLTASDVAVLPYRDGASYRRGSLMAVLAHGLPIVTTEPHPSMVSGILPRLENGRNAVLVPRGDPIALAQGVVRIMNDARLAARLRQGAQAVAAAFTWDSIAQRTLAFYQRVLGTTVSYPHAHPEWTV
jgi:glycosyltransferase involved in cell wall biosynthesis